jgi:hypothetical protein
MYRLAVSGNNTPVAFRYPILTLDEKISLARRNRLARLQTTNRVAGKAPAGPIGNLPTWEQFLLGTTLFSFGLSLDLATLLLERWRSLLVIVKVI